MHVLSSRQLFVLITELIPLQDASRLALKIVSNYALSDAGIPTYASPGHGLGYMQKSFEVVLCQQMICWCDLPPTPLVPAGPPRAHVFMFNTVARNGGMQTSLTLRYVTTSVPHMHGYLLQGSLLCKQCRLIITNTCAAPGNPCHRRNICYSMPLRCFCHCTPGRVLQSAAK